MPTAVRLSTSCAEGASPPPGGEGLGVGGIPASIVELRKDVAAFNALQSPPPCPSPTRGEGTMELMLSVATSAPCPATTVNWLAALFTDVALVHAGRGRERRSGCGSLFGLDGFRLSFLTIATLLAFGHVSSPLPIKTVATRTVSARRQDHPRRDS